jgi:Reverse transcriptase (RNA-dependent DNA polymerase)
LIILQRYSHKLLTSELQFGFKAKCSTNICTLLLKETVNYYVSNQSTVFCTFLDATKAFDRIRYCKLFKLLMKRDLPACIIRTLYNLYTRSVVRVLWSGVVSPCFCVENGVKQGAVLSPVLFSLYIDDLLLSLSRCGVGCYIGPHFVGALAYADDIVLIAPTAGAMRRLLSLCSEYAKEFNISFNAGKSKCLMVAPGTRRSDLGRHRPHDFVIDGQSIAYVHSFKHLGHVISSTQTDNEDIALRQSDFIAQVNNLLCFFKSLDHFVRCKLFHAY